jgi:hypothetical protein
MTYGRILFGLALTLLIPACASLPPPVVDPELLTVDEVRLDPTGQIDRPLLQEALASYARHYGSVDRETRIFDLPGRRIESDVHPIRRDVLGVIDYRLPAIRPRFYIIDLKTGEVDVYRVAHGRNSDAASAAAPPGLLYASGGAIRASNQLDSNQSAVGAYVAANVYNDGRWPGSMRLHGLDRTNSCSFYRAIVLHQNAYMTPDPASGQVGTSDGCLAVDIDNRPEITARLEDGGFIYAGPASLHRASSADGLTDQLACEAVRLKPELGPQSLPPGS